VIRILSDEHHERLWRICDALVSGSGARAAMVCDAASGAVIVSVGDTSAAGAVSGVEALGPGERVVRGASGQIYGVDVPGGALLAVLHDPAALESVRALAAEAVHDTADLLASLPQPPAPAHDHDHKHEHDRDHDHEHEHERDRDRERAHDHDHELEREHDHVRETRTGTAGALHKEQPPRRASKSAPKTTRPTKKPTRKTKRPAKELARKTKHPARKRPSAKPAKANSRSRKRSQGKK
jgi:hypothetical protein